jgi:hypothetical protein
MTNEPSNPPLHFLDNPHAPDVFADSVAGIFFFHGNIRLTLESLRVDHSTSPGPLNRVVIGRLVLPLAAAKGLRDLLDDYLGKLEAQSAETQAPGPDGTMH